jgi:hypothetical protein
MQGISRLLPALFGLLGGAISLANASPATFPLTSVKRGQTGYGYTTMKGYVPEKFSFEVVSVVKNFLAKQDIVLVKSDDPKMAVTGFWQGMSGSPLYIDDKVMCAFSYGFRFNKIAVGGCTPIQYMIDDAKLPRRGPGGAKGDARLLAASAPTADLSAAMSQRQLTEAMDNMTVRGAAHPLAPVSGLAAPMLSLDGQVLSASVPLAVGGFSSRALTDLTESFRATGIVPMQGGLSGAASTIDAASPSKFVMGGSISVLLMRGDMSAAATGTVSYIDGNTVLAFGHPFFQVGELYAPVATAEVHTVIASAQSAFVMATPQREIGSLVADRQSSIAADLSLRSPMIPLNIEILYGPKDKRLRGVFKVEMASNKFLTPSLAGNAVNNAIGYYLPDRDDVTALVSSTVKLKGLDPISFTDFVYANDGAGSIVGAIRGLRVLGPLFSNSYGPVGIDAINIKVDLSFDTNFGDIKELKLAGNELVAGKRNMVTVVMETWNGSNIETQVPVDVPESMAGAVVTLDVSPGDSAKLDAAPPTDLPSLLAAFRKLLPGNVWAATLYISDDGIAYEGKAVRDAPPSVIDKLRPASRTQKSQPFRAMVRTISPSSRALSGSASTTLRVRS